MEGLVPGPGIERLVPGPGNAYLEKPEDVSDHDGDGGRGGADDADHRLRRDVDGLLATLTLEVRRVLERPEVDLS